LKPVEDGASWSFSGCEDNGLKIPISHPGKVEEICKGIGGGERKKTEPKEYTESYQTAMRLGGDPALQLLTSWAKALSTKIKAMSAFLSVSFKSSPNSCPYRICFCI
jgi:hypothetical protein